MWFCVWKFFHKNLYFSFFTMLLVFGIQEDDDVQKAIKIFKFPQTKVTHMRLFNFDHCHYQQKLKPFRYCINEKCKFVYLQKTVKECTV